MRIKKEFCMRNIYGESTLVPVGETASSFKGIIKVNEIGSFIWNNIEKAVNEEEIVSMIVKDFNLDFNQAKNDVYDFINYLKDVNII